VTARPFRSVLYVPASRAGAAQKAAGLPCDAVILDLEDAVAPAEKEAGRAALVAALGQMDFGRRLRIVRVNGLDTAWGRADVESLAGAAGVDALLIPKVGGSQDVQAVADLAPGKPLWAMLETPLGVLSAAGIAAHPALAGLVMGTNDLAKDLGARDRADRLALLPSLGLCLLAARAHGRVIVDGVCNAFRDPGALAAECAQGRDLGFDGKSLIHPDQIAAANAAFSPTEAELDLARRQIAAFEAPGAAGQVLAVVDGKLVETLHILRARALLAKAAAIAEMG
jgi:(3S)-malyl-CoA thioesterase